MNIGTIVYSHWPSPSPTIMRPRWGAQWRQIETARGTYNFTILDGWISTAQQNNTQTLFTFLLAPSWISTDPTAPPPDLNDANETCQAPLAGVVRPGGNCMFAEFVTALMQHVCGVTSQPGAPLAGKCSIRIFESWNEFNDGQFWSSNYTDMAKMANDAAVIIRKYCADCTILAGNTSAGGDGYIVNYYHNPAVAARFDLALGQFLDAWHNIPNAALPDAVSFHAYGARRNVIPYPMPETNVSMGSSLCTAANVPNPNCDIPLFNETAAVRTVLQQRPWAANLPIWNSEGGLGRNDDLTDGVSQTDWNTNFLRQAYVARWMLAMASSGTVTNLWYEYDDPCWGTMMGYGTPSSTTGCPEDPTIPSGFTPIHQTWVQMLSYLNGATFNGPCTNSGTVWKCVITKGGQQQEFVWTTKWLTTETVNVDSPFNQYADLAGVIHSITTPTLAISNQPVLLQLGSSSPFTITPTTATVTENATLQFTAPGATSWITNCHTVSSTGLFTAPLYPSTSCTVTASNTSSSAIAAVTVVSPIVMTPASAATSQGKTQQFTSSMPVTWSAGCGSITASGLYTASAPVGTYCTIKGIATGTIKYTVYGYDKIIP
jgi:hypothetical protein